MGKTFNATKDGRIANHFERERGRENMCACVIDRSKSFEDPPLHPEKKFKKCRNWLHVVYAIFR